MKKTTLLTAAMLVLSTFAIATPTTAQDPDPPSCEDVADEETCDPGAQPCQDGTGVEADAGGEEVDACLGGGGGGSPPNLIDLLRNLVEECADTGSPACGLVEKCTFLGGRPSGCELRP